MAITTLIFAKLLCSLEAPANSGLSPEVCVLAALHSHPSTPLPQASAVSPHASIAFTKMQTLHLAHPPVPTCALPSRPISESYSIRHSSILEMRKSRPQRLDNCILIAVPSQSQPVDLQLNNVTQNPLHNHQISYHARKERITAAFRAKSAVTDPASHH